MRNCGKKCLKTTGNDVIMYIQRESTHSKVDAPIRNQMSLWTPPLLWTRQERHYFLCLFLLLRKASNAITKLPKAISKANIPMKIEIISKAVISATSSYVFRQAGDKSGGYHSVMGAFHINCIIYPTECTIGNWSLGLIAFCEGICYNVMYWL